MILISKHYFCKSFWITFDIKSVKISSNHTLSDGRDKYSRSSIKLLEILLIFQFTNADKSYDKQKTMKLPAHLTRS